MLELPSGAALVLAQLHQHGHQAYVVGGCVRDSLLGLAPKDWDICTDALPEQMQQIFAGWHVIETGLQHGTLTVMHDHEPYEVTTFRVDGEYTDHRHPDSVTFVADVREDLARRDFTVNAMAWSPATGLVDAFGGQEDLAAGIIRCVGDPNRRFEEDALRIMRAMRFASVYGFRIDEQTDAAIHALKHTLIGVAAERIRMELAKLLCGAGAEGILLHYQDVLTTLLPALRDIDWAQTVRGVAAVSPTEALRLTMLLRQLDRADIQQALTFLKLDNATRDRVLTLTAHIPLPLRAERYDMLHLLSQLGEEVARQLLVIQQADASAKALQPQGEIDAAFAAYTAVLDDVLAEKLCYTVKDMAVNGRDLMALGLKGRAVGECLNALLDALLHEALPNERNALLAAAQAHRPA